MSVMNGGADDFWRDPPDAKHIEREQERGNGTTPHNPPRPGELDVKINQINRDAGLAFCHAWDYAAGGFLIGDDKISPIQVGLHISDIVRAYPTKLHEGVRFRVIPSKTKPGSTFEYFGKIISLI
jgi:hypothetical protein